MEITFDKKYLKELYIAGTTSDKKHRFQPQIIAKYRKTIDLLESVNKVEDLYRFHSLNYEVLQGDKAGLESVRVNNQYRLEFKTSKVVSEIVITVCNIVELSNHYKSKYMVAEKLNGFTPTHPGEVLKDEIEYRNISQKALAKQMGISYKILNDILNCRRVLTTATAMMFEAALDVPADSLMRLQLKYNMQMAKNDCSFMERLSQIRKYVAVL